MKIVLHDNGLHNRFAPLTLTRPLGNLRIGILTNDERWKKYIPNAEIGYQTETFLAPQFGIIEFQAAAKEFQDTINKSYEKWDKRFEGVEAPGKEPEDSAVDKEKIQAKINSLNAKISSIKNRGLK